MGTTEQIQTKEKQLSPTSARGFRDWLPVVLLLLTMLFISFVRWRIADTSLERDEGEYAYGGQLFLHGVMPYKFLYNIKLPGTYAAYAVIMAIFGQTPVGIHVGLLFVNLISIWLVYLIGKKLAGATAGVLAAVFFAFLSIDPSLLGFAAQATHFVVLFALIGFWFLLRAVDSSRRLDVLWGGIALGTSFICKQPGLTFGVMGFVFVVWLAAKQGKPSIRIVYGAGWLAPYLLTCLAMWAGGCFETFWIWTTKYAGSHSESASIILPRLNAIWHDSPIWIRLIFIVSVAALGWFVRFGKLPVWKRLFLVGLFLSAFAAVFPGFSFYRHYFIMVTPAVALIVAVALVDVADRPTVPALRLLPTIAGVIWTIAVVVGLQHYFFENDPDFIITNRYKGQPFLQTRVLAGYLARQCPPDARIAVLESEPEMYFYTQRKAATGFIYGYDMTGLSSFRPEMQEQFKREVTDSKPDYVVLVCCRYAWSIMDESGAALAEWCWQFPKTNYTRIAIADNAGGTLQDTVFKFDNEAASYTRRSSTFVEVYRRNGVRQH